MKRLSLENEQDNLHQRRSPCYSHILIGFLTAVLILLIYAQTMDIYNKPTVVPVLIFNFLFVFLVFPLKGTLRCKTSLLLVGNAVGLFWNMTYDSFFTLLTCNLGENFNIMYVIFGPILGSIWVVVFWSLGLSFLTPSRGEETEVVNKR